MNLRRNARLQALRSWLKGSLKIFWNQENNIWLNLGGCMNLINDTGDVTKARLGGPVFGTLTFYFFLHNWKLFIILTSVTESFTVRIEQISKLGIGWIDGLILPACFTTGTIILGLVISSVIELFSHRIKIYTEVEKTILTDKHDIRAETLFLKSAEIVREGEKRLVGAVSVAEEQIKKLGPFVDVSKGADIYAETNKILSNLNLAINDSKTLFQIVMNRDRARILALHERIYGKADYIRKT